MKQLRYILIALVAACTLLTGCIDDSISTSPSDQPTFSVDTLDLGELFTLNPSPTARFVVYNRNDKGISLQSVRFTDNAEGIFRLNVDGMTGTDFRDVEIRANDSIFIFVEATLPENHRNVPVEYMAHLEVVTNGVAQTLPVRATGRDVTRLRALRVDADMALTADRPYQIFDSLVVAPGVTLTVDPGAELLFHDAALLRVYGSLQVNGTASQPVVMTGDRTGFVAADIPYEVMSGQWGGIELEPSSRANRISHASIRNSEFGIVVDSVAYTADVPSLAIDNSVVRNSKGYIIAARNSSVRAVNCDLSDSAGGSLYLYGGDHTINHCTLSSYYLFSASGPAVSLMHTGVGADPDTETPPLRADFANCILYGLGPDLVHYIPQGGEDYKPETDIAGVDIRFRSCLLKSNGEDDDQFINCVWGEDPLFLTKRDDYIFDYRLMPESPALGRADATLTLPEAASADLLGSPRPWPPAIGCYEAAPVEE